MAPPPVRAPGAGSKAQVRVEINNAVRGLIRALSVLQDVGTDEARAILSALKALAPVTPDVEEGVSATELKSLLAGAETAMRPPPPGPMPGGPIGPMGPRPQPIGGAPPMGMGPPMGGMMGGGPGGP